MNTPSSEFLMSVHDAAPGITENVLKLGKTADGRSSYEMLADAANLKPGMTAVDLACGSGALTRLIAQRVGANGTAVGIDLNRSELALAAARCKGLTNARLLEESAAALSLPDASADAVLCHMALMLFQPIEPSLAEIARVLRPSGVLAAVIPGLDGGNKMFAAVRKALADTVSGNVALEKLVSIGCPEFGSESGIRKLFAHNGRFAAEPQFAGFEVIFRESPENLANLLMPFFYYTYLLSPDAGQRLKTDWADIFRQEMAAEDETATFRLPLSIFTIHRN